MAKHTRITIAVAIAPIILIPNHHKSEHSDFKWVLNWNVRSLSPRCKSKERLPCFVAAFKHGRTCGHGMGVRSWVVSVNQASVAAWRIAKSFQTFVVVAGVRGNGRFGNLKNKITIYFCTRKIRETASATVRSKLTVSGLRLTKLNCQPCRVATNKKIVKVCSELCVILGD